jgi:hypothetical protein
VAVTTGRAAVTYACATSLSPAPVCSAAHTACLCAADSDCASGRCVNAGQCTGTCTGTGNGDLASCALEASAAASYACASGKCSDVTSPADACSAAGVACWCARDADCPGAACVPWAGCASGACTGTGATDAFHCGQ